MRYILTVLGSIIRCTYLGGCYLVYDRGTVGKEVEGEIQGPGRGEALPKPKEKHFKVLLKKQSMVGRRALFINCVLVT